jgi:Family of unknown function (DUF6152)
VKAKFVIPVTLFVALVAVCAPAFAHHGNVAYDVSKPVLLHDCVVTKFMWSNPHSFVLFDAKDEKGSLVHWAVEAGSPSALSPQGWSKLSLQPGDMITVYVYQSKTHQPVGRLNKITLADGTVLRDTQLGNDGSQRVFQQGATPPPAQDSPSK